MGAEKWRIRALLFDFDGVLADTEPIHYQAWSEILRPYGISMDWETFQRLCVGISDTAMLERLCGLAAKPVTVDELRSHYPRKRKLFREFADGRPLIHADLVALIKSLNNINLGVVTSSSKAEIESILKKNGLLETMKTVVYGNDVSRYKPHPEPYLLAVQRLGVDARDVVVFEDSDAGIQSAAEAGCRVVRVSSVAQVPALVRSTIAENFDVA